MNIKKSAIITLVFLFSLQVLQAQFYKVYDYQPTEAGEIEAAMCHGCGVCASECPAKAIQLMHYKDSQIISKTMALFHDVGKVS